MMNEIYYMPKVITKDTYFRRDLLTTVDKDEVEDIINKEVEEYIEEAKDNYEYKLTNEMTESLKTNFISKKLREFIDNSYLIRIKNGCIPSEDSEEYTSLNRIIRKVTKDRPNDFSDVIKRVTEIIKYNNLDAYSDGFINDELEETVEDELIEAIENEENKIDRLTKYIHDTVFNLYNVCFVDNRDEYYEYYEDFLKKHDKEIKLKVSQFENRFRLENEEEFRISREKNIVNLFNYLLNYYSNKINWYDDGKRITLITSLVQDDDKYLIKSGLLDDRVYSLYTKNFKELRKHGTTFTLILKGE